MKFKYYNKDFLTTVILLLIIYSCNYNEDNGSINEQFDDINITNDSVRTPDKKSNEANYLDSLGLMRLTDLDSTIKINLRYTDTNNFLKKDLYGDLIEAYLQPDVAIKLANASKRLREQYPGLRLLVWDAVRPVKVQRKMWEVCEVPMEKRHWFVTPPGKHSLHNYGAAVDLTLIDTAGKYLSMGTDFDHFGVKAYTDRDEYLINNKLVSEEAIKNRLILRKIMEKSGFTGIKYEWWHFNSCSRETAKSKYKLIFGLKDKEEKDK